MGVTGQEQRVQLTVGLVSAYHQSYMGSASLPHSGWRPAGCRHAACAVGGSNTSRATVSGRRWLLLVEQVLPPWANLIAATPLAIQPLMVG